jgi:poly(3-hydroxybutyrate) depolymerase
MNTERRVPAWGKRCGAFAICAAGTALTVTSCSTTSDSPQRAGASGSGGALSTGSSGGATIAQGGSSANAGGSSGGLGLAGAQSGGAQNGGAPNGGAGASAGGAHNGGAGATATGGATAAAGASGSGASGGAGGTARSAGCGKTSTVSFGQVPGESGQNVGTGAGGYVKIGSRGFAMRLPDNYQNTKPYPLFFGFHWNGGNSKEVDTGGTNGYEMAHFGLQKRSKNGALFVAPDGLNAGWANSGGQDLKLVDDMLKLIEDNYCVDTTHIFTNGFSYGGGMSYELACARAKIFRGAAIYEGAQLSGCDGGNDPIARWQMFGLTDTVCGMNLATPIRDRFVKNNGCTVQNPAQPAKPPPYSTTAGHICTDYAGCSTGHPLRWCVHQSGHGNAIVDGTADLYNTCASPPKSCSSSCPCSWVPDDVWKFFSAL